MKKFTGFSKTGAIVGALILTFIGAVAFLIIDVNNKATNYDNYDFYSIIEGDEHTGWISDHVKGDKDTPVVIYEYADFQCGYCAMFNPRVNAAIEQADGKLAVVYRNYVLSYHQNGIAAASAAEAAGLQGYWKPYADKVFEEQNDWAYATGAERTALFVKYFEEVTDGKGDIDKFKSDMSSENVSKKLSFDNGIGKRLNVAGTPAFYVDGQLIDFSNKNGSEITVNGRRIGWETQLTGEQFTDLLVRIAKAKTED